MSSNGWATDTMIPIRKIVVLGGGSAGLLVALALRRKVPQYQVTLVRSTKMGVIGVGEGTIGSVVSFLHRFLELDSQQFHAAAKPSLKLGIRYLWGRRPFFNYTFTPQLTAPAPDLPLARGYYCREQFESADLASALMLHNKACIRRPDGQPQLNTTFAYHLENKTFVGYLEQVCQQQQIEKIDAVVESVECGEAGVQALHLDSGMRIEADLFVDCSGFRSELLQGALGEKYISFRQALFCDRAVVGGWPRSSEIYYPFTTAETMDAGWCWRIEHDDIINRGYVYSSSFISDEQAESEFRGKNPQIGDARVVRFEPGVYRHTWVKNVVAIGNSAGFVEPLEATAIAMICDAAIHLVRSLDVADGRVAPVQREIFNRIVYENWVIIRDFLAIHYRFNDRLDTPFWQHCRREVDIGTAEELVQLFRSVGPDLSLLLPEFKRNFFTDEGYLVMLVGQQVPYQRQPSISESDWKKWRAYCRQNQLAARDGMDMRECLSLVRSRGLPGFSPAPRPGHRGGGHLTMGHEKNVGELNWH